MIILSLELRKYGEGGRHTGIPLEKANPKQAKYPCYQQQHHKSQYIPGESDAAGSLLFSRPTIDQDDIDEQKTIFKKRLLNRPVLLQKAFF